MARTLRAPQALASSAGLAPAYTAADNVNGENFANNGRKILHVKNPSGGSLNVIFRDPVVIDGQAAPDRTVAIAAGADRFFGPLPSVWNQADGSVWVDYSGAGMTAALLDMPLVN